MHFHGKVYRSGLLAAGVALGVLVSTSAQALNFSFRFSGNMSCMRPVPVSNAPISGSGTGVLNPDGSVTAQITQSLAIFSTSLQFDSKLGPRVTAVPGGTGQVRVVGKQSLKFIWNLPNNTITVTVNVHGNSCNATFATSLLGGKSEYTFFDGSMYHYCGRPMMTSSSCEVR